MDDTAPTTGELENLGYRVLRPPGHEQPQHRTYVIVGLARSGTTMIAKLLDSFGLFMGEGADNTVGEDTVLSEPIESADPDAAQAVVDRYDAAHDVWGFKRPNIFVALDEQPIELRNPHYIVVFRDLFSIANRNYISTFRHPIDDMRESLALLDRLVSFVETRRDAPMMLLSYERVLSAPRPFVLELADFCGVELTPKVIRQSLHTVTPGGGTGYLEGSRVDSFFGRVTDIGADTVGGHFRYHGSTDRPPLELYVNGEPVETDLRWEFVDLARPSGRDFSGDFGFTLTLVDGSELSVGDTIDVIADDRRRQRLKNCPYRVRRADLQQ